MAMMNRITDRLLMGQGHARRDPPVAVKQEPNSVPVREWLSKAEKMITTNPGASLACALGVGILLGWLVKRT